MVQQTGTTNNVIHTHDELLEIFSKATDLPTLPEVAIKLLEMVNDPDSNAKDVAHLIDQDPAITIKVLKMVNTIFYAPSHGQEITHLQAAIARLGFVTVTNIALSTSVFEAFAKNDSPLFDRKEFWRHSICVGIIASVLYDFCSDNFEQHITRDMLHLAGIVHDMGKILFERYANDEFHQAIGNSRTIHTPILNAEENCIGMSHDKAGAWLAKKWNLGDEIISVIRYHHNPLSCPNKSHVNLIELIHMADYICHNQLLGDSGNPFPSYDHNVREKLGLTPERIGELMVLVKDETAKSDFYLSFTT
jgi:HD-like signal output (HDOD) protein